MSEDPGSERVIAGRYRLLSPLGEGGMGTVWRARDEVLQREVAVKEVRAPAGLPAHEVERMYARLEREAWAAARISNRNVVTVYDVAAEDGRPWIVMELIRGIALSDLLDAEGPLPPRRAAHIGAEVLAALRAAHEAGVLHRDVKPGNVLMANDGRIVLTDFGIAMVEGSSALTMTGEVIGSPEFLAPERALGRTPGPESDLWSLGVLLYAAVEGNSPFRQNTPLSTLRAIVDEPLPPPRRAGALGPVIEGLLVKDPAERMTAEQAERDLRIVAAGGTMATTPLGSGPPSPDAETLAAVGAPPLGPPGPPVQPAPWAGSPPARNRRAAFALIAGLVALALALGGLTYALLNRDNGGGGDNGGGTTSSGGTNNASSGGNSGSGDNSGGSDNTGGGGGGGPSSTAPGGGQTTTNPPAQSVEVTVTGRRTDYNGACPPPGTEAPSFTATFTVGRVPAEVEYRWVTENGDVTDPDWKTLSFPAGGGKTQQKTVVATTYDESGTFANEISVEVRDPVHVTSNSVPFSITCATETPTDGASASVTP
ncbi:MULTISPECIES: serine/threonine-protein kinase [Streptomyces]|uniref:non-specific serine/threonine protein kinase n=1 Tax=Streptomyces dengpaensis TaxID=2049881 RepID=A0ABN5I8R2_9ACTN|nr:MULTISPECIES: serine/threonine-protein kinase [Streptomyces]AVH59597.1 serine/threonine protein kinase [Streptomyces dengpaensis]PIB06864.1 serine/threonine protein kinase [Streptomyces sp. HG99]